MLRKIKKAIPAVVSAILCIAIAMGMTVSAQPADSKWNECKKLINSSFDQQYIDLAIKYKAKESKNTVVFSKSRTKKFFDRYNKAVAAKKPEFSMEMSDKNSFEYIACKGAKSKYVFYEEKSWDWDCEVVFSDGKTETALSLENKTKTTFKAEGSFFDLKLAESDIIDANQKGKFFKFKSGGKVYYYEEFIINSAFDEAYGLLFNENGEPLAAILDNNVYCVCFKTKVDDSEFNIPKGYKTVSLDDFKY